VIKGNSGTRLDQLVQIIQTDKRLIKAFSDDRIEKGAAAANGLNKLIADAARATGATRDGDIDVADVHRINDWIRGDEVRLNRFENLQSTFEDTVDGQYGDIRLSGKSAINKVADHIYNIGLELHGPRQGGGTRFESEDGAYVATVARWLDDLLY
jgi:hypothetical protein